jgi:pantoate--beta-alanine ligase
MQEIKTIQEWKDYRKKIGTEELGFVPTMGALHEGHLCLVRHSLRENKKTVVSIFVNPAQFNDPDDLENYPKDYEADCRLLEKEGVDCVFQPMPKEIYADKYLYKVIEDKESKDLCGLDRPGHYDGVLSVILKFLNLIEPQKAYFGEKDYLQYKLVKGMAEAFFLKTEIIASPTIRDPDGLAMSSRNLRLNPEERELASHFPRLLHADLTAERIREEIQSQGIDVDYIKEKHGRRYGAVNVGPVRLIDNISIP